ncbi:MAG: flagellar biosynthetic protein FliQ [Gemmatimonadales bacterium]
MSAAFAIDLIRRAVMLTLLVSAPLLVTAVVVGLLVTLLQAVTQLQEQTLTFLPKVATMALVLLLVLPWMIGKLVEFLSQALRSFPLVGA